MSRAISSRASLGVLLAVALSVQLSAAEPPAARRELLRLRSEVPRSVLAARAEAVAGREVEVRFSALQLPAMTISLPDGTVLEAVRTSLERRGPASFTWRGTLLGDGGDGGDGGKAAGQATLTVLGGRLRGTLFLPPAVYEIAPAPGGSHRLLQVDPDAVPPCGVEQAAGKTDEASIAGAPAPLAIAPAAHFAALPAAAAPLQPTRIALLAVYTPAAVASAGGAANLRLYAQSSVDLANTAFQNSRLNLQIQLAGLRPVGYAETGQPLVDLEWVATDPGVAALRAEHRAGLVTLLVDRMEGFCGYAKVLGPGHVRAGTLPEGFHVVDRHCTPGSLILAHEIGHNFGCQHDPANAQTPLLVAFPFAYAHFVDGEFRTIMSYPNQCTRGCPQIPFFGHPEITFEGTPTGVAGQRDSQRVINLTKGYFAAAAPLRTCRPGPDHLCLLGGRYEVRADWENQFDSSFGVARAVPRTGLSGFFSFGDPGNLELLVKILDFGDAVKLFYGQLTNLRFTLTVTDTRTGITRTYQNGPRECGAIDHDAFPPASALRSTAPIATAPPATAPRCRSDRQALCLLNRFRIEVEWQNPGNGQGGRAAAVPLSGQTGAFSFTDASNLELLAKVVDAGGRIDVFYGSLSDLEYTLRVTDTATGEVRTYQNPAGTYCGGLDVGAF